MAGNNTTPTQTFLDFIAAVLAAMFLPCCDGNIAHAQILARETILEYGRSRNRDLIAIARSIAFDLGALAAIGQSLSDEDIPITVALRLRQNALACDRVSERTRKQLDTTPPEPIQAEPIQAEPIQAEPIQAEPIQAEPNQPTPQPPVSEDERIHRTVLANAMFDVARQLTAEAAYVEPLQAKEAAIRCNILTEAANTLLAGMPAPETPLPRTVTINLPNRAT